MITLSENERTALCLLRGSGGGMLTPKIPDRNEHTIFGVEPGITVYKKLEKKGLLFFTEEQQMEDGFAFTNEVYLTEKGWVQS